MIKDLDANAIADVILESDREGNIVDINDAVQDMFGYSPSELIGRSFNILMPEHYRMNHDKTFRKYHEEPVARKMGRPTSTKFVGLDKLGQEFYIDISLSSKENKDGSNTYIAIIRDVSEMVALNEELNASIARLESKNKELEHMSYMISHDLKAPTRVVKSLINIMHEDYEDKMVDGVVDYCKEISLRVSKMSQLIDDILSYSRAGQVVTNEEEINLQDVIHEALDSIVVPKGFDVSLKTKNLTFVAPKTPFLQVMTNLISNAIKYHDKSSGKVDIEANMTIDEVEVKIIDDGPGIPDKYHSTIFEMFGTANKIRRTDSTGIGLAIVKKIIAKYGGSIIVNSEVGKGSEFIFTFKINSDKTKNLNSKRLEL